MFQWSITLIGTIALLGGIAAAQDSRMFSSDLIAWSGMQQPTSPEQQPQRQQPTPEPSPQSQPAPTPSAQTPAAPNSTETSTSPAQFIMKLEYLHNGAPECPSIRSGTVRE